MLIISLSSAVPHLPATEPSSHHSRRRAPTVRSAVPTVVPDGHIDAAVNEESH
jgi:hypothetical protein